MDFLNKRLGAQETHTILVGLSQELAERFNVDSTVSTRSKSSCRKPGASRYVEIMWRAALQVFPASVAMEAIEATRPTVSAIS